MLTDEQLAEIRERVKWASPGPWELAMLPKGSREDGLFAHATPTMMAYFGSSGDKLISVCETTQDVLQSGAPYDNAKFVAHARTDIATLLAEVDELRRWKGKAVGLLIEAGDDSRRLAYSTKDAFSKHYYTQQAKAIAALLAKVD
jgi:hypothetical protein